MKHIVFGHCHAPRATTELERVLIAGRLGLLYPECPGLVFFESATADPAISLEKHGTERAHA